MMFLKRGWFWSSYINISNISNMSAEQLIQYHSEEMIQEDENLTGQKYLLFQPTLSSEGE